VDINITVMEHTQRLDTLDRRMDTLDRRFDSLESHMNTEFACVRKEIADQIADLHNYTIEQGRYIEDTLGISLP
jgi:hypothetical protein